MISAKDHASVQINVGHVGEDGRYTKEYTTFAFSGYVRKKVRSYNHGTANDILPFRRVSRVCHAHRFVPAMIKLATHRRVTAQGESDAALEFLSREKALI